MSNEINAESMRVAAKAMRELADKKLSENIPWLLAEIEAAANKGEKSYYLNRYLNPVERAELSKRGFKIENGGGRYNEAQSSISW